VRPQFVQGRRKRLTVRAWLVGHYNAGVSHEGGRLRSLFPATSLGAPFRRACTCLRHPHTSVG
jgi:hypothetical protein